MKASLKSKVYFVMMHHMIQNLAGHRGKTRWKRNCLILLQQVFNLWLCKKTKKKTVWFWTFQRDAALRSAWKQFFTVISRAQVFEVLIVWAETYLVPFCILQFWCWWLQEMSDPKLNSLLNFISVSQCALGTSSFIACSENLNIHWDATLIS